MKHPTNNAGMPGGHPVTAQHKTKPASEVQGRGPKVAADEEEAMRRKQAPAREDEAAEAEKPQVAEIESILAAFRH